jgi:hypothetical protein
MPASEMTIQPTRSFLRLAALGALCYVGAQVFQWMVIGVAPTPASPEEAIVNRLLPLARARSVVVMVSFPAVLLAYAGVALCALRRSPGAAIAGFAFAFMFVAVEMAYRSVDVFVVTEQWARLLHDSGNAALTARIVERAALWREIVNALYFPLLLSNALASMALAAGVWNAMDRWCRALSALFIIKAVQAGVRILEMHFGLAWLSSFNFRIYFPITISVYGFTAFWLWLQGERFRTGTSSI